MSENPLGRSTEYTTTYSPDLLFGVPRIDSRNAGGYGNVPFTGMDLWNAWELTWLDSAGKPVVATAEFRIPADSPNIVESKSLKLYLNSLAMTRFRNADEVSEIIRTDLSVTAGSPVVISLVSANDWVAQQLANLPGTCIDGADARLSVNDADSSLLRKHDEEVELDELHSHLFRSVCPVTSQPDMGSILVRYSGSRIDPAGLLSYLVSYREHPDFHEACVERIFVDVIERCSPRQLTVQAFFNRRGGLDIDPFRSNFEALRGNLRLWRQ